MSLAIPTAAAQPAAKRPPSATRWSLASWGIHAFLVFYGLLTLVPFTWALITSLKTTREIAESTRLLPVALNLDAYRQILQSDFKLWFFNSMFVAITVTVTGVVANTLAGYALARLRFRGRGSRRRSRLRPRGSCW